MVELACILKLVAEWHSSLLKLGPKLLIIHRYSQSALPACVNGSCLFLDLVQLILPFSQSATAGGMWMRRPKYPETHAYFARTWTPRSVAGGHAAQFFLDTQFTRRSLSQIVGEIGHLDTATAP